MLDSKARLRPNKPDVLAELVEDQVIIVNQSTDVYYRLDRVGGLIWSMLCESCAFYRSSNTILSIYKRVGSSP